MLPEFLVKETTVREAGESEILPLPNLRGPNLTLTLGITHAMEHESIDVDVYASHDGDKWSAAPVASFFTRKYYCGTYQLLISGLDAKYAKLCGALRAGGEQKDGPSSASICSFRIPSLAPPASPSTYGNGISIGNPT